VHPRQELAGPRLIAEPSHRGGPMPIAELVEPAVAAAAVRADDAPRSDRLFDEAAQAGAALVGDRGQADPADPRRFSSAATTTSAFLSRQAPP
jgi:hypothetical protein